MKPHAQTDLGFNVPRKEFADDPPAYDESESRQDEIDKMVEFAKTELNIEEGVTCPTCNQFAKMYKRKLASGPARNLIWLYRNGGYSDWVHIPSKAPKYILRSNEMGKLKLWGLVEEKDNDDKSKKCSGFYKVTDEGRDFVLKKINVAKYCFTYNNGVCGYSEETISIEQSLGERFDYQELMESL